jgi:hypothetical protein
MSPRQFAEWSAAQARAQEETDRIRQADERERRRQQVEQNGERFARNLLNDAHQYGPDLVYLYDHDHCDRDSAATAAEVLRQAGWDVHYGRVRWWNNLIYHFWVSKQAYGRAVWYFRLQAARTATETTGTEPRE